jgi:hypothetical protein
LEAPGIVCGCRKLLGNIFKGFKQITGGSYATLESVIPKDGESGRSITSYVYRAPAVGVKIGKREDVFIKHNVPRDVYLTYRNI